jgi:hypothetical protein
MTACRELIGAENNAVTNCIYIEMAEISCGPKKEYFLS